MSENDSSQDKSFEPSERRRQEFRDKGQVPRSQEVNATVGLIFGVGGLILLSHRMASGIGEFAQTIWQQAGQTELTMATALELFDICLSTMMHVLGPLMFVMWISAAAVGIIQGQLTFNKEELIKFDWERINPVNGAKEKFFSSLPLVELLKGVGKIGLIGYVVWMGVREDLGIFPMMVYRDPVSLIEVFRELCTLVLMRAVPVAIIISVLDYVYQWWKLREKMMMSREDLKEEMKRSEGDPYMKAARRQRGRQMAMARTIQEVQRADVIITNPTHFAVALRYRKDEASAPIVVARGVDHLALKIREEARLHDIPRVENRPLARALYAQCKEGQMIPEDLYAAVAEILALIWRRRRKGA